VLGYDLSAEYIANADMYFGATVGRVAQRIGDAAFVLDGVRYPLVANNGRNHLHGGVTRSFDKVTWHASAQATAEGQEVEFTHVSPHMEEGYPGRVEARVTYRLTNDGEIQIHYEATSDRPTPISLTNHSYWNLAGAGAPTILDHELTVWADRYTPTDDDLIPTGEVLPVDGTPLDLRQPTILAERMADLLRTDGLDHNLVLAHDRPADGLAARLRHPASGRVLEIRTGQPCLQVYSGNLMRPTKGKLGRHYDRRSGICLEPQRYPDAVRHPAFESVIVGPGTTYREITRYRLVVDRA
jgi:aldose 1-epimerase